jgi:hypothetical protein
MDFGSWHGRLRNLSDDDFLKYRLRATLRNCLDAERLTRDAAEVCVEQESDLHDAVIERTLELANVRDEYLTRGEGDRITHYNCLLGESKKLTVALDETASIKSIMIDGKLDDVWNNGHQQVNRNIDEVLSVRENAKPTLIQGAAH